MGYLCATLTQAFMCAHAWSGRVTQRCHYSPRWETGLQSTNDVTQRKRTEDLGNLKKVREWRSEHRTRRLTFVCSRRSWAGVARDGGGGGGRWKSQNRKIVPLSSYVEKLKGNKKFRTGTKKSLCVFRISRFLCSIFMDIRCTFYT